MNFTREETDGRLLLKIKGELTVYESEIVRDELLICMSESDSLALDLDNVNECDTAGIQLLCSAKKTAEKSGKYFSLSTISEVVREAAIRIGLNPETDFNNE